jgi:hypothetical protein
MRFRSINFAGYRSFAGRSPAAQKRPLEELQLAPLTILIGKNNSGKSTVGRLVRHVLVALASEGRSPFPMSTFQTSFGASFRDIQHNGDFFNPLDLNICLEGEGGGERTLEAQIIQINDSTDNIEPVLNRCVFDGNDLTHLRNAGLLPSVASAEGLRNEAKALLAASCYIGPMRDAVEPNYLVQTSTNDLMPQTNAAVAQLLLADQALKAEVAAWMVANLDGWMVDAQQTLGSLRLIVKRGTRETNLAFAGQGIQQVLPVAALCCWRKLQRGAAPYLDLIEQPELHLHDAAHAPLGDLLLNSVENTNGNLIVETHSEALILRIRRRIAEGLSPSLISLVYVEDTEAGSRIRKIPINDTGEVDWWPEGIFSEAFMEVKAIRQAQRKKSNKK